MLSDIKRKISGAKAQVMISENGAAKVKYVIDNATPCFKSKEEYIEHLDSLFTEKKPLSTTRTTLYCLIISQKCIGKIRCIFNII